MRTIRFIVFFLVIIFAGPSFAGQAKPVVGFIITSEGLGDHSFNDMAYTGLLRVKKELDFVLIRELTDHTEISRTKAVKMLVQRGAVLIVANGWEFRKMILDAAPKYADTRFLINDAPVSGYDNVVSTEFAQNEGSFLAGALSGWMTKTGKVGFVGGEDMPVIRAFQAGFDAGLKHARHDAELMVKYIAPFGNKPSGFRNPREAYRLSERLYRDGVDIIFGVAGLSGNGVIHAAKTYDKFAIGVDADQDHMEKGIVLTSVMKRLDNATYIEVKQALTGKFKPGIRSYDLKKGGVSLSPMTYTRHLIPAEILKKLADIEERIKAGTLEVPGRLSLQLSKSW